MAARPMMFSRSRTGGGPPSGAFLEAKKRLTEKVEQGGDATMAAPACWRKAEMPSGRLNGPENKSKTVRDKRAGCSLSGTSRGMSWIRAASLTGGVAFGSPGG
eukprot:5707109-Pleurochrysis_carterae.AAC.1